MIDQPLNLVVVGASGVGKSTFLNYLLDKEEFITHRSAPATLKGFWHRSAFIRGFPINLIDSWGLEAGKSKEWIAYFQKELVKRGVQSNIADWFHGVCYLISAPGNRVQDFDLSILGMFIAEGYSVVVVLTKAGKVSEDTIKSLKGEIAKAFGDSIPVVAVDSVRETIRDNHVVEPFGIDEFEQELVRRFWETIRRRIPLRIGHLLEQEVVTFWDIGVIDFYLGKMERREFFAADKISSTLGSLAERLKYSIKEKSLTFRETEIATAKNTYSALAECLEVGASWEMPKEAQILEVQFISQVVNPSTGEKFLDYITLGFYDASESQRALLRKAANEFSITIKNEIHTHLIPQISYSIDTIKVNSIKLSKRKQKSWIQRFLRWVGVRLNS